MKNNNIVVAVSGTGRLLEHLIKKQTQYDYNILWIIKCLQT